MTKREKQQRQRYTETEREEERLLNINRDVVAERQNDGDKERHTKKETDIETKRLVT